MLKQFTRWLRAPRVAAKRRPVFLSIESLEQRANPVVGALRAPEQDLMNTGVVRIDNYGGVMGSGTLLWTGRHILTAAHVVDRRTIDDDRDGKADRGNGRVDLEGFGVTFTLADGTTRTITDIPASAVTIPAGWNGKYWQGNDIAIIELPMLAPAGAERHDIYRSSKEVGQTVTLSGYGRSGTGNTGDILVAGTRRAAQNRIDLIQTPERGPSQTILSMDFDNGLVRNDQNGRNLGLGALEGLIAPGDSGGPAFIGRQVAGVASGGIWDTDADVLRAAKRPDGTVISDNNGTFGELSTHTRVSKFTSFIDKAVNGKDQIVLDMSAQTGGNDGKQDVITLSKNGSNLDLTVNGQRVFRGSPSQILGITIRGSNDSDHITLNGNVGVSVTIEGGLGSDAIVVYGTSGVDNASTAANSFYVNGLRGSFSSVETITFNLGAGNDAALVQSTASGTTTRLNMGTGADKINVGAAFNGRDVVLDGIRGRLILDGGNNWAKAETDTVFLNDFGNQAENTYAVTANAVLRNGTGAIEYEEIEALNLKAGTRRDTIIVASSPTATKVSIDAGGGRDVVEVGPSAIGGNLSLIPNVTVSAGREGGELFVNDQLHLPRSGVTSTYTVADTWLSRSDTSSAGTRLSGSTLWHFGFNKLSLKAGQGNDVIRVISTTRGPGVTVDGGLGNDVLIGSTGSDTLIGNAGNDVLIGNSGGDKLYGGDGEDLLIGGKLSRSDDATLRSLRDRWAGAGSYADRAARLRAELAASVVDDGATDELWGGSQSDWFWGIKVTELKDRASLPAELIF